MKEINVYKFVLNLKKIRGHEAIPNIINLLGLLLSSALDIIGP